MKSSFGRRALAVLVLIIVAAIAIRLVIGVISAIFWIVALIALVLATLWAVSTLRSGARDRREVKQKKKAGQVPAPPPEDPVEVEMRKLQEQLRQQGR